MSEKEYRKQLIDIVSYYYEWGAMGKFFEIVLEIQNTKLLEDEEEKRRTESVGP